MVYDVSDEVGAIGARRSTSAGGYLRVPTAFRSVKGDRICLKVNRDQLDNFGVRLGADRGRRSSARRAIGHAPRAKEAET
jgi:hypothetical protein